MNAKRKILYSSILAIVFTVLIKIGLPDPSKNEALVDAFWIGKTHGNSDQDIVFGGDSRMYRGVSTKVFLNEMKSDLDAYNFGYSSGGYSESYLQMLESKLDQKSEQKIIVLGISPHSLTPSAMKNEGLLEYKDISWFDKFEGLYFSPFLKHFSPYKVDELVDTYNGAKDTIFYSEIFESDGWVKSDKIPADSTEALVSYRTVFNNNQVNYYIVQNLMNKISEWSQKGITVVGFRPPTTMAMYQLENHVSGFDEAKIKSLFVSNGGHWIDVRNADFISYDGSHLDSKSAEKISSFLGKKINSIVELN